jgi:hypothetical protein
MYVIYGGFMGKRRYRQTTIWEAIEEDNRKKMARIIGYSQRWEEEYKRYATCLDLVPPGSILQEIYDTIFKGIKEAEGPAVFADCWAIVSHLLTRKDARIELIPGMPIFTWFWEMVIGLSGISKSLPVKTLISWFQGEINKYPDDITTAALKAKMLEESKGFLLVDEVGELFDRFRDKSDGLRNLLLGIVDTPSLPIGRRGSKKKIDEIETHEIKNPALTMVGNTTMADFETKIDVTDFFSGLMQRWNYTLVDKHTRTDRSSDIELPYEKVERLKDEVSKWLEQISQGRVYSLSTAAKNQYEEWYKENLSFEAVVEAEDAGTGDLISFKQRQKLNIVRSSIVYEAVLNPRSDVISKASMVYAVRMASYRMMNLYALLKNYMYFSKTDELLKKVMKFVTKAGPSTKSEIFTKVRGFDRSWQVQEMLEALVDTGQLTKKGTRYELNKDDTHT